MQTATTLLQAVNTMLVNCGEQPVNTLSSGVVSAVMAQQILQQVSIEFQSQGWSFNREQKRKLAATYPAGEIILPQNTLSVDTTDIDIELDLVQRGNKLYDRENATYQIGKSVFVDLVVALDFDDMPQAAKNYVIARASRLFQEQTIGSQLASISNQQDERKAWGAWMRSESRTEDRSLYSQTTFAGVMRR